VPVLRSSLGLVGGPGGRNSVCWGRWRGGTEEGGVAGASFTPPRLPPQSSGVTATVFGGTGFLGRYVINALARDGHRVVVPYRCDELDVQHLRQMGDLGQIVQVPGFDVRDPAKVRGAIDGSAVVFNLIGATRGTRNFSLDAANRAAPAALAKAAADAGVERFVHVTCVGAAPGAPSERLRSKAAGDAAVRAALPASTLLRCGPLVGVEDTFLNAVAAAAKALPAVPLIGGGKAKRVPTFVADVARALAATLRAPAAPGRTYELVGPEVLTDKEIALAVLDLIREPRATLSIPPALARLLSRAPLAPAWLSTAAVDEATTDLLPVGGPGVGTFADLGVDAPDSILAGGAMVDHLRWLRTGGYDVGTTSGRESTGGAGFGASVS